jgi:hypothetical protein
VSEDLETGRRVLALPMEENDAGQTTIHGYLVALVDGVWEEREGFSGKRPFGNSGWEWELYAALSHGGLIPGIFDKDGYADPFLMSPETRKRADTLIGLAIGALLNPWEKA